MREKGMPSPEEEKTESKAPGDIRGMITLSRLQIEEEDKDGYHVVFEGKNFFIAKDPESSRFIFRRVNAAQQPSMQMEMRQEALLLPSTEIFQDASAPKLWKEVMMLHEIRESEYVAAGFKDAHERAMNDEVLYIVKHFSPKDQRAYRAFAEAYRTRAKEKKEKPASYEDWKNAFSERGGYYPGDEALKKIAMRIPCRTKEAFVEFQQRVLLDLDPVYDWGTHRGRLYTLLLTIANAIPDSEGPITLTLPKESMTFRDTIQANLKRKDTTIECIT
ncbi:hypothetical protein HY625_00185 [Candidatus Uhrbacteria bacterium]|nr:hypothetical protein [Candidatus Uhrbacteria bacterium]